MCGQCSFLDNNHEYLNPENGVLQYNFAILEGNTKSDKIIVLCKEVCQWSLYTYDCMMVAESR